jgi:integrase
MGTGDDGKGGLAHREEIRQKHRSGEVAPHDLRRTSARLCHASGGELEQIQFPLGHVSVQTTER